MQSSKKALPRSLAPQPLTRLSVRLETALIFVLLLVGICGGLAAVVLPGSGTTERGALEGLAVGSMLVALVAWSRPSASDVARRPAGLLDHVGLPSTFDSLVANASDPTIVLDDSGTIRSVSPSLTSALGYTPETLVSVGIDHIVSPPDGALAPSAAYATGTADG